MRFSLDASAAGFGPRRRLHRLIVIMAFPLACAVLMAAPSWAVLPPPDSASVAPDSVTVVRDTTADADGYTFPALPAPAKPRTPPRPVRPVLGTFVGLAATAGPPALALALTDRADRFKSAGDAALITGSLIGYLGGPALGLWSSGRPRRALTGLAIRGVGLGFIGMGLVVGNNLEETNGPDLKGAAVAVLFCCGGALVGAGSLGFDLYSLPRRHATDEAMVGTAVILRPDGKLALQATF